MKRRTWLRLGCAHCVAAAGAAWAQPRLAGWEMPARFTRPDLASDEGGLWALMDREEVRLRRSNFRLRDENLQNYLGDLVCRLGGPHCGDVRTYAVRSPYFNATMAPNGMMQIWSGLLLRVENEAQLCAVLGHEVGHYLQRHSLLRLRESKDRAALATFLGLFGVVGLVGQIATIAGMMAYSREHEREADQIGLDLMRRNGYDTREAAKVWGNLIAELKSTPESDPTRESALFASHPPAQDREATLAAAASGDSGQSHAERFMERIAPVRPLLLEDEIRRNRPRESVTLLERLCTNESGNPLLLHYRAEALRGRGHDGDEQRALDDQLAAVATGRPLAITHRSLGLALKERGNLEKARFHLEQYLQSAPLAADAELIKKQLEELR